MPSRFAFDLLTGNPTIFDPARMLTAVFSMPPVAAAGLSGTSAHVLGCHMVGADAAEIMQGLAIAIECGATKAQFDRTVGIHPSSAEEFVTMREKSASSDPIEAPEDAADHQTPAPRRIEA